MNLIKKQTELLVAYKKALSEFIAKNTDETYYCLALTCNYEYAEILLGLNSEKEFAKTLEDYQNGEFKEYYQTEEDILDLKYNTGDWSNMELPMDSQYHFIATEDELEEKYSEDIDTQLSDMKEFAQQLLLELIKTEEYKSIPKTLDFSPMIIDHEDDPIDALEETKRFLEVN